MEIERLAGGRVNIRMGKPVRKERLAGGRGNIIMGKPRNEKVDWRDGNLKDEETC